MLNNVPQEIIKSCHLLVWKNEKQTNKPTKKKEWALLYKNWLCLLSKQDLSGSLGRDAESPRQVDWLVGRINWGKLKQKELKDAFFWETIVFAKLSGKIY